MERAEISVLQLPRKQRAFEYIETGKEDLRKLSPANPAEFEAGVREWMTAYCEMNDYRKTGGRCSIRD